MSLSSKPEIMHSRRKQIAHELCKREKQVPAARAERMPQMREDIVLEEPEAVRGDRLPLRT